MTAPHDLITRVLEEFAADPHRHAPANLDKPTRAELLIENAKLRAHLSRLWLAADDYREARQVQVCFDAEDESDESEEADQQVAKTGAHLDETLRSIDCNPALTKAATDARATGAA